LADSGIDEFMLCEIIKQVGNPPAWCRIGRQANPFADSIFSAQIDVQRLMVNHQHGKSCRKSVTSDCIALRRPIFSQIELATRRLLP
jgi:hypothetical protein